MKKLLLHHSLSPALLGLLLALIVSATSYGQRGADIRFDHLSLTHGLSQGTVNAIVQDRQGFMWFATWDGLNKYDGHSFTIYKHQSFDSTSLSSSHIRVIYEDRSGMLWVGTDDGGLNRLDPVTRTITRYPFGRADSMSLSNDWVHTLYEDRSGVLWIGTFEGTLHRLDRTTGAFTRYRPNFDANVATRDLTIYAIVEDHTGALWLGTFGQGLHRFDPATETFTAYRHDPRNPNSVSNDHTWALYVDQAGTLWVGTDNGGMSRFNPKTNTFTHYRHDPANPYSLSHNQVTVFLEDRSGAFWVGTRGGGLNRFDRAAETFTRYRNNPVNPHSLSSNDVQSLYEDRSGVLWIGTLGAGINKFVHSPFSHYHHDASTSTSLSDNYITSLFEESSGVVWVGTNDEGLNKLDLDTGLTTRYRHNPNTPSSLCGRYVKALHKDHTGTLWVGTSNSGVCQFNPVTQTFINHRHDPADTTSLSDNDVRVIYEDRAGQLWIGTNEGWLNRYDRETETFVRYKHDTSDPTDLSNYAVVTITESSSGALWLGTTSSGLSRFDPETGASTHYRHDPSDPTSLSGNNVLSVYEDHAGFLWVGVFAGGLSRFDPKQETFVHFTEKDGLPNNTVYGILPDEQGHLWLSTNKGLARFNPETHFFTNYDDRDGLQGNEFNVGAYHKGQSGHLYFGGTAGMTTFRTEVAETNQTVPPVVLTTFKKLNEDLSEAYPLAHKDTLNLSYRDDVISFSFAALDYWAPEKNQYAYKLEGFDEAWITLGTKREVTFTNLDPKTYTLRVRGSNNHGVWNEEGFALRLRIAPPFWSTWWFRLLVLGGLVAMLVAGYKSRTRSIRLRNKKLEIEIAERKKAEQERKALIDDLAQRNAEMERFTYTVSHDLKAPLVTIKGFLGLLRQDTARGDIERMESDIEQIGSATDKMARLLSELLELSRVGRQMNAPEATSLSALAAEAVTLANGAITARGVAVEIQEAMPVVYGDRIRLLEVYQNLIVNAVKFMGDQPKPHITIGAQHVNDSVRCYVQDNGIGIKPEYHEKVFRLFDQLSPNGEGTGIGLALVKRIVETHGGMIWIESAGEGQGTTFWFTLPASQDAANVQL